MKHLTRKRQTKNTARRKEAERKQAPLPLDEQRRRAEQRQRAEQTRYPVPPTYRNQDDPQPQSPKPRAGVRAMGLFIGGALRGFNAT